MSSSHHFVIMSLHVGQNNYHEVCAKYLSHFAISSIDSGKGSWIRISKVFIVSERPEALFMTFTHLRNVESTSSIENIMILIFDKPSRRGADNRRQVPVIDTKHE